MIAKSFIRPGAVVLWKGRKYVVIDMAGIDAVLGKDIESGGAERIPASEIMLDGITPKDKMPPDLALVSDKDWQNALDKLEILRPLIEKGKTRTAADVIDVAKACKQGKSTIYRWLSAYEKTGLVSSLLRRDRTDRGKSRLHDEVEKIIAEAIEKVYLTAEHPDVEDTLREIELQCHRKNLKPPHRNTLRRRIQTIPGKLAMEKRLGRKAAKAKYSPIRGHFPGADYPLAVVQIDHTKADIILVDDKHRLPIGRPNMTLAIDVYSRMVLGFYISLDPPGALSTGLCLAHAMLPKDEWLASMGIDASWPCWGKIRMVHADNAKEFRGTMLSKACEHYGIILENRPKGEPQYGGHVERGFRTFMKQTHRLKGTTFSNVAEKADYDSEGNAVMTLAEFERWFATYIVKMYHHQLHKGIKTTPYQKWEEGILGTSESPGIGMPARVADEDRLRLDFMPFIERTVQEYGVVVDNICYYSDVLRKWIHALEPGDPSRKRKLIFRLDFRDISVIQFFDPDTQSYAPIPYRDATHPPISVWELRAAEKRIKERGLSAVNETLIFEALEEMREIEQHAETQTKRARRENQRRRNNAKAAKKNGAAQAVTEKIQEEMPILSEESAIEDILPYDDIEEASL